MLLAQKEPLSSIFYLFFLAWAETWSSVRSDANEDNGRGFSSNGHMVLNMSISQTHTITNYSSEIESQILTSRVMGHFSYKLYQV